MTVTYRLARNEQNEDAHMIVGSWQVACGMCHVMVALTN